VRKHKPPGLFVLLLLYHLIIHAIVVAIQLLSFQSFHNISTYAIFSYSCHAAYIMCMSYITLQILKSCHTKQCALGMKTSLEQAIKIIPDFFIAMHIMNRIAHGIE